MIGGTANEIRATLDELACRLAARNNKPPNRTYFPISKTAAVFADDAKRKLADLSLADRQTIINLETNGDSRPFIFGMHDLDRIRKHQRSFIAHVSMDSPRFSNGLYKYIHVPSNKPVREDWTLIMTANLSGNARVTRSFIPVFVEPAQIANMQVVPALNQFVKEAREIVALFD